MNNLNSKQLEAVKTADGKILVLAGAGSGKTSVIISRIIYLVKDLGVNPTEILGLTFTNKAAIEMRSRLEKAIGKARAKSVLLCTFHSYCFHLLKRYIQRLGYTDKFSIYDEKDIKRLFQSVVKNELPETAPALDVVLKHVKENTKLDGIQDQKLDQFRQGLMDSLRAYNAVDFDGLIDLTLQLFEEHPDILKLESLRFRYIMIDEYQDTNPKQYRLAEKLSSYHNNICVVGDDDQSIYGWRGANVKHILEFPYDKMVKLEQNYRSTSAILDSANEVIKNNTERHNKKLWSNSTSTNKIHIFHAPTDLEEADGVVQRIVEMKTQLNLRFSDFAILYRSNVLSRPFEKKLMEASWQKGVDWVRGIPYQIVQGTEFYERAEVKDIIAYLKAIVNPKDNEALLRIINFPRRGISSKVVDSLTQYNRSKKISLWEVLNLVEQNKLDSIELSSKAKDGIRLFLHIIKEAQLKFDHSSFEDAFSWLVSTIGYRECINSEFKSEQAQTFKWENVIMIKEMLNDYEKENPDSSLYDFLSECMLDTDKFSRKKNAKNQDAVQLMTFHSAKGLEFEACFLVGLEDNILPHEKSVLETGVEEERRLFYVALTRAKKYLTLSMARSRQKHGKLKPTNPSRFLFEIPKDLLLMTQWNFPVSFFAQ